METYFPGDHGYDEQRTGFQTAFLHRPAVIFAVENADDVRKTVRYAADHDLDVTVQTTGHGTQHTRDGGVLITTGRMTGVRVDPEQRTARVEAGALWHHVITAAAPHGLVPLSGSSPDVGVVGYTLRGGIGLLAREFGYARDHVRDVESVDGVVTALEIALFPVARIFGGHLIFDATDEVFDTFRSWTANAPDTVTTSIGLVGDAVHVRFAGTVELDMAVWQGVPAREDTVGWMPFTESGDIYRDPTTPHGYYGDNILLSDLTPEVLTAVRAPSDVFTIVDIRHMGGALGEPQYLLRLISPLGDKDSVRKAHDKIFDVARPWTIGRDENLAYGPH